VEYTTKETAIIKRTTKILLFKFIYVYTHINIKNLLK